MPIRPENRSRYPAHWPQIRARILARAGHCCERCGVRNYALGGRTERGTFLIAGPSEERGLELAFPAPGTWAWCYRDGIRAYLRVIRIVLTIAHLDHVPENCADENLLALCQRCHLLHDARHHAETAYATRRVGRAIADLFHTPETP